MAFARRCQLQVLATDGPRPVSSHEYTLAGLEEDITYNIIKTCIQRPCLSESKMVPAEQLDSVIQSSLWHTSWTNGFPFFSHQMQPYLQHLQSGFAVPDTSVWCDNGQPSVHLPQHQLGIKVKRAKRLPRNNSPGGVYCVAETRQVVSFLILSYNMDKALYRVAAAGGLGSEPRRISDALTGPP